MLDIRENRLDYMEQLKPYEGYKLDCALCLTYSLDFEAVLTVLASLSFYNCDLDLDKIDKNALLNSIDKIKDKIMIFCNASSISIPKKFNELFILLERNIFPVKGEKVFHPKIWLLKYTDGNKSYIKLVNLTRNLTFDKSIDLCVSIDFDIKRKKIDKNKSLVSLLENITEGCVFNKKIANLINDVSKIDIKDKVDFIDDYEFVIDQTKDASELFENKNRILIVSPFLSDKIISKMVEGCSDKFLITRAEAVTSDIYNKLEKNIYIVKDKYLENDLSFKSDIHAKLYYVENDNGNYLFIGSTNATNSAFYKNYEFMIKFKLSNKNRLLFKQFTNSEVFNQYEYMPLEKGERIDKINFSEIINHVKGKVIKKSNCYSIQLSCDKEIKEDIKIGLLSVYGSDDKNYGLFKLKNKLYFDDLKEVELTQFFVLECGDKKTVVKIELDGLPESRDSNIYKSIINENGILNYINVFLSDDYISSFAVGSNSSGKNNTVISTMEIYERLLKKAKVEPESINDIEKIISLFTNDLNDEKMKEDFDNIRNMCLEFKKAVKVINNG